MPKKHLHMTGYGRRMKEIVIQDGLAVLVSKYE